MQSEKFDLLKGHGVGSACLRLLCFALLERSMHVATSWSRQTMGGEGGSAGKDVLPLAAFRLGCSASDVVV